MASIEQQSVVDAIEHLILPDYIGLGIPESLYGRLPHYAAAVHGEYVYLIGDDDVLADHHVVARVQCFAKANDYPPVIVVGAEKGRWTLPADPYWPPKLGRIDLACLITRSDIWRAFVTSYGQRYEGDFDFAHALASAGFTAERCDILFATGGVGRGSVETEASCVS
jgi:hypothetical protein